MENSATINFGKYKGQTLAQIAAEDMNWVIWLAKNFNVYSFSSPNPYAKLKQSTIDYRKNLVAEARQIVEAHYEKITEANRENSLSDHFGKIGMRLTLKLKVIAVVEKYDYSVIKTETPEGNKIYFYDKGFGIQPGQEISATGTICKQTENLGIKVTYINRVKITQTA
jgi:hypothetical protein